MAQAIPLTEQQNRLSVSVASGDSLDVRQFDVKERVSSLFEIKLTARSENHDIDFEAVVGKPASFTLSRGSGQERTWTGLVNDLQQVGVEPGGLSTYELTIVPTMWLLTQRRNHRMFQLKSEVDIVVQILGEWGIKPVQQLSATYKKRKYRVQYAESDYGFVSRMLEDAGISFYFENQGGETKLVLHDAPQKNSPRPAIAFNERPTDSSKEHATKLRIGRQVRPGKYTVRDHDYRRPPSYKLLSTAGGGSGIEEKLERFHYAPGSFLFESDSGDATPVADDKGKYRTDEGEANALAQRRLEAKRAVMKAVHFESNAVDLAPGVVTSFQDHPKSDLAPGKPYLVLGSILAGMHDGKWTNDVESVSAEQGYRPEMVTPKPKVTGVESATITGPAGEEIHTDEFGRVRVHFHWDRESKMDDNSSCWIHTSQPWGGTGFGGTNLPRVGQEVIVDFLNGDPDRPLIVGRVYTNLQKTPYKLPDNKTQSGWKSNSSPGGDGYNEMMFEDRKGQELVRMQAEKDLDKLVKHDETVRIGNDRKKQVGRDDKQDVGRNRDRTVGNNETAKIGNDEQREVGNDRSRKVGNNEQVQIGKNRSKQVGETEDVSIGKDFIKQVMQNERELTGLSRNVVVGVNRATQVGAIDSTLVGDTHTIAIAPAGEMAGGGGASWVMKRNKIVFKTPGGASITLENDKITLEAAKIEEKATAGILIESGGGDVTIKGTPKIKLNP